MMRAGKHSMGQMRFVVALLVLSFGSAHGQSSLEDIHVVPRGQGTNPHAAGSLRQATGGVIRTT